MRGEDGGRKGLYVLGRILDFIVRAWETVVGVSALTGEWREHRGTQQEVQGEAEPGGWDSDREGTEC